MYIDNEDERQTSAYSYRPHHVFSLSTATLNISYIVHTVLRMYTEPKYEVKYGQGVCSISDATRNHGSLIEGKKEEKRLEKLRPNLYTAYEYVLGNFANTAVLNGTFCLSFFFVACLLLLRFNVRKLSVFSLVQCQGFSF